MLAAAGDDWVGSQRRLLYQLLDLVHPGRRVDGGFFGDCGDHGVPRLGAALPNQGRDADLIRH